MRIYILIIVGTVLSMNVFFMGVIDIKKQFFSPPHAELPDKTNFTEAVHAALPEMVEFSEYTFHSFIGWKAPEIRGSYFNVNEEGIRRTVGQPEKYEDKIFVFGGSTAWGYGLADEYTIPSEIQKLVPDTLVVNMAEMSYNATQELNKLLISLTEGELNEGTVLFFDGVNEIYHSCTPSSSPYGHGRELQMRKALNEKHDINFVGLLDTIFLKYSRKAANKIKEKLVDKPPVSLCGESEDRAWQVARRLVTSWQAAHDIATARGLKFKAFLQPNPYSDPKLKPHFYSEEFKQGTEAVYPKVVELAKDKAWFVDGRTWLEGQDMYFDWCCHVHEKGNALLAAKIVENLPE